MALGGGTFVSQNKILPGSYINIVSTATASAALSDRGVVAAGISLATAPDGVFEVTNEILNKQSFELFYCDAGDDSLRPIREILLNAKTVYVYNLNDAGARASNTYATAKNRGTGGNNIITKIEADPDNSSNYIVSTLIGSTVVDEQSVLQSGTTDALEANAYVTWKSGIALAETVSDTMTGGTTKSSSGTASQQYALNAFEPYTFNVLCIGHASATIAKMVVSYTKTARDDYGKKFQSVVYNYAADYEGVVNLVTRIDDSDSNQYYKLMFWVAGALAGCAVNRSLLNKIYNGEYTPVVNDTQAQLESYIENGKFAFHKVGDDIRVLKDINSLVSTTEDKGDIFKSNQTIRVVDQIANDIADVFNTKYLGVVQNSTTGRALFKADIIQHHNELNAMNAIEGFTADDVTVEQGTEKGAVVVTDAITVIGAMEKLYMTVYVS